MALLLLVGIVMILTKRYPDNVVLGTEEQLQSILKIAEPIVTNGTDISVLVNEVITLNAYYHGTPPNPYDFSDMEYLRIDDAFSNYCHNQEINDNSSSEYYAELEYFYTLYGNVVERIYLFTYQNIEQLVNEYGAGICHNLRYQQHVGNDLVLTSK